MEDDKKVKDSTVPDKAPEKNLKKPSGKSATGKPLDGIDINPQLNDVSTDGNQLKIRKEDSVDLAAPVIQERKALTLPQRQKRARQLRAREHSMERAREVAKTKLAPKNKIEQRALAHARAIVKKRFAARKGTPYAELTTTEKIQVDTAVAKKTKLIQKIAARLLPRIRKAEFERLQSFRNGGPLKDLSTQNPKAQGIMPKVTEEMSQLFNTLNDHDVTSLIAIIENAIDQFKQDDDPMGDQLKKMLTAVLPEDVVTESLLKKSDKTGIPFSTLKEVFERGEYSWDASNRMSQEQYAFARVNSYIGKGRAWHMDADLREEKTVNAKLDESFTTFLETNINEVKTWGAIKHPEHGHVIADTNWGTPKTQVFNSKIFAQRAANKYLAKHPDHKAEPILHRNGTSLHLVKVTGIKEETQATKIRKKIEVVDRPPASQAVKTRQQEIQKKIIDESGNTPYVKPHIEKGSTSQSGWKASNKHGNVKYFGKAFKASALKHAGINEGATMTHDADMVNMQRGHMSIEDGLKKYSKNQIRTGIKAINKFSSKLNHPALKEASVGVTEDTPSDREIGTDSLVKKYKKDTPGQKSSLDESFNMAWTSGIGVTLSAADCGIKIKGGFSLHPDVIEQINQDEFDEEVRTADVKGEIVAGSKQVRTDPKTGKEIIVNVPAHVSRGKLRRKIIGSGDVHNGETE